MKLKKRLEPLVKEAKRLGFTVEPTRKGHLKLFREGCQTVFCPSTPSDNRGVKNTISQLRRSYEGVY